MPARIVIAVSSLAIFAAKIVVASSGHVIAEYFTFLIVVVFY